MCYYQFDWKERGWSDFFFHLFFASIWQIFFSALGFITYLCSFNINNLHSRGAAFEVCLKFCNCYCSYLLQSFVLFFYQWIEYDRLSHCLLHRSYLQLIFSFCLSQQCFVIFKNLYFPVH